MATADTKSTFSSNPVLSSPIDEEARPPSIVSLRTLPPNPGTTHTTGDELDPIPEDAYPEGNLSSWLVVLGAFFLLMSSYGIMTSLGAFQSYFATNQLRNYSSRDIGWITGLFVFMAFMLGVQIGPLFDRHGPRGIVLVGSASHVTSLFLLAECKVYWQFLLCFGLLSGGSVALLSTAALSVVPQYFHRRAGLAMGLAMAGSGVGGVVFPFILRAGWSRWGWKWGIRLFAFLILIFCIPPILFVKPRLPKGRARGTVDLTCFKDSRFTFLTLGLFFLEINLFAGLTLYPTYVVRQGFPASTSIILLAVLNSGSCVGRFFVGVLADRYGRLNTLTILITLGIVCIFAIWLPFGNTLPGLYCFSVLFGLAYGSVISLSPVCMSQISRANEIGLKLGTCYSVVSFANLICIPLGGEMLDKVGSTAMVLFLGFILVLSLGLYSMARWACLEYRWRWRMKV